MNPGVSSAAHNLLEVDGIEPAGSNGYAISASWLGARGFQTVAKKDGQIIGRSEYTVSPDGRSLTISDDSGDSVIVLERV